MSTDELAPEAVALVIIVPIHGHVALAMEALLSARAQAPGKGVCLIAIVDGDGDASLARRLTSFAAAPKNRCSVYWRRNGGLSAARNTGIEIALERFPKLEAVFFLDADNRLAPSALGAALRRIERNEADILYPDLTNFGLRSAQGTSGRFSQAALLRDNYVEAGSLVSARVLRSGLRFDESLREGYEDWDFWLRAAGAGFRLAHEGSLGLQYRRRPESMLANTGRHAARLRFAIEAANRDLFSPSARRKIAARDEPRFAIVHVDRDRIDIGSDLLRPAEQLDLAAGGRRLHLHRAAPTWTHFPSLVCFAAGDILDALRERGLLPGLLWRMSAEGNRGTACTLTDIHGTGPQLSRGRSGVAHLLVLPRSLLCETMHGRSPDNDFGERFVLSVPSHGMRAANDVEPAVQSIIRDWETMEVAASASTSWNWRHPVAPRLPAETGDDPGFPHVPDGRHHIGLVHSGEGGPAAARLARAAAAFAAAGWVPHLILLGGSAPADSLGVFATTTFLEIATGPERISAEPPPDHLFFGARLAQDTGRRAAARSLAAFDWLDAVVVFAIDRVMSALGILRGGGTTIVVAPEPAPNRRALEHRDSDQPYILAAYEHAIDIIWVTERDAAIRLTALSVPREKIVLDERGDSTRSLVMAVEHRCGKRAASRGFA